MPTARKDAASPTPIVADRTTVSRPISLNAHDDIRRELTGILASPEFSGSHRGQMMLSYLVENALEARAERLKERTIGVEVFHRDASYDTGQDAIVRVAANDVRKRLAAYYVRTDPLHRNPCISLPPGSYVPEFSRPEGTMASLAVEASPPPLHLTKPESGTWHRRLTPWAVSIAVSAMCVILAVQNLKLRSAAVLSPAPSAILPWSQIAAPGATVILVASDSNFSFYKSLVGADQSLEVYTSQRWLDDLVTRMPSASGLVRMPLTSIANASVSAQIGSVLRRGGSSMLVRSGRMVHVGDFKSDRSVIMIGSSYANPWVSLVNEHLNFRIAYDPALRKQVCRNASPLPGEYTVYEGTARTPAAGVGYATISLVPNLSHNGFVLLIAGTNMEGTEAAGELVTDLPRLASALRKSGIDPSAKVEQLELLLRLDHMDTQSGGSEVIAHRVIR